MKGPRFEDAKRLVLDQFKPNTWNPNRFTKEQLENLKHGFQTDGWVPSQALLVWATDEKGTTHNVIIDGEHRWTVARELGMQEGPVCLAYGLTEAEAKALTVKLDAPGRRGSFDVDLLGAIVRDIQHSLGTENLARDLAMSDEALLKMLALPEVALPLPELPPDGATPGHVPSGMGTHVKMVQLFFNEETHGEFMQLVKDLAPGYQTKDVSATTLEAMRNAARARTATKSSGDRRAARG